ncbi:hypothetical protein [Nocardioides sp. YIM 152315]|uniref:hypothetical protein n=1 Tax=Nocardioides sp. YIM 152315 TaxID=3031760 RepID=UPI0023DC069E|nr:hypothetical protein [Nocardioides sp. YIM 152315]MDF1605109.1 hypothetical protein [Nocardioides sp. YIM 152315]
MDTDIRDEIDRSFGDGPPTPAPELLVARGRAALHRRRLAEAGSMLVVAVIAVGATAIVTSGDGGDHGTPEPAAPSPSASASTAVDAPPPPTRPEDDDRAASTPVIRDRNLPLNWPLAAQPDGLHVSPKVKILKVVDDPLHLRPDGAWSVAVSYRGARGEVTWWVGYVDKQGSGSSSSMPARFVHTDFDSWVAREKSTFPLDGDAPSAATTPGAGWPGRTDVPLVRFADGTEELAPLDGVTLLQQRPHPDLPDS